MSLSHFFFNDTATTEIYTLSLHDALPISFWELQARIQGVARVLLPLPSPPLPLSPDRKSTRLNSSHANISYAVFCLKKQENSHAKHWDYHKSPLIGRKPT